LASAYTVLPATPLTQAQINVTSPNSPTPIYSLAASLPGGAVFTLFMLGDASAPIGKPSKDR
jgi:hypothetical protein